MHRGDRLWFQLSAHPCFAFCPHSCRRGPISCSALYLAAQHPMVLPLLESVHITKGEFPCPSWTAQLCHSKAGLCTDFHSVPLKLAHWQQGWSDRAASHLQGPWGRAWMSAGAQLYWWLLLQKETPLCLLPSLQRGYWQLHFNQFFCLSYLFHPRERSPMTSPAMPQHVLVIQSLQMGQTKSPFQASFHLRFLQHGPYKIILKWLLHDLWEMWLILEKMLLKLNS